MALAETPAAMEGYGRERGLNENYDDDDENMMVMMMVMVVVVVMTMMIVHK